MPYQNMQLLTPEQEHIITLLGQQDIDLKTLYSKESLKDALAVLNYLLEEEKKEFADLCSRKDDTLSFGDIYSWSVLDLYFWLLQHRMWVISDELIRTIITTFQPVYVAFSNEVMYSKRYYEIMKYLLWTEWVENEPRRILEKSIQNYEIRGIHLDDKKQNELKDINSKLAQLSQKFSMNVIDDKKWYELRIANEKLIHDMPSDDKKRAEQLAKKAEKSWYLFDASYGAYASVMKYCSDKALRKKMYTDFNAFASEWEHDNRPLILEILSLREKKAQLIGHKTYAQYSLERKMASSPEEVISRVTELQRQWTKKALEEIDEMKEYFWLDEFDVEDMWYYSRLYKQKNFSFDENEWKQYFELEQTLQGMFDCAEKLYGITFEECLDSPYAYTDDIRVFEVSKGWVIISLFVCDLFYREEKSAGAWANVLRSRFSWSSHLPVVINVSNIQKSVSWPTLLTEVSVHTMFHEFWHALHEVLSRSSYSELTWFGIEWDMVELPSQLMENRATEKEALQTYAKHYETGEMLSDALIQKMKAKERFGKWYFLSRQWELWMVDMMLYSSSPLKSVEELDDRIHKKISGIGVFQRDERYKMHATFSHIFAGWYAAGYYSYLRAEILEAQVLEEFLTHGMFDPVTAQRFEETILGAWCAVDAEVMLENFLPWWMSTEPYMKRYGVM